MADDVAGSHPVDFLILDENKFGLYFSVIHTDTQTQTDTDRHRQTQTDTDRHRQTDRQTYTHNKYDLA